MQMRPAVKFRNNNFAWLSLRIVALAAWVQILCFGAEPALAGLTAISAFYPAHGAAADVIVTRDNDVIVSVTPQNAGELAGLQVFRRGKNGYSNPCGNRILQFPPPLIVDQVYGLSIFPDAWLQLRKISIGAAVEADGVNFFRAVDLNTCVMDGFVNVQQLPIQDPSTCQTCSPGTFALAVTPAGAPEFAFVANEYGIPASATPGLPFEGGTIGVVKIRRDLFGRFLPGTKTIPVNGYINIPGANTIPGVTMSRDGKRLYVVNEDAAGGAQCNGKFGMAPCNNPTGSVNPSQVSKRCLNQFPGKYHGFSANGVLSIIDVEKAERGRPDSIMLTIAAGCAPVRVVESMDGRTIWVASRGGVPCPESTPIDQPPDEACQKKAFDGQILSFDVRALLSDNKSVVNSAFKGTRSSGGTAPVGMALFGNERYLAVANSNRFTEGTTGETNVAILSVRNPSQAPVVCKSASINAFPRGVAIGRDDRTVYVANFGLASIQGGL
jgi:DNA-binding beta-propeller fold protein YncE